MELWSVGRITKKLSQRYTTCGQVSPYIKFFAKHFDRYTNTTCNSEKDCTSLESPIIKLLEVEIKVVIAPLHHRGCQAHLNKKAPLSVKLIIHFSKRSYSHFQIVSYIFPKVNNFFISQLAQKCQVAKFWVVKNVSFIK